jgi:hypothetical protein
VVRGLAFEILPAKGERASDAAKNAGGFTGQGTRQHRGQGCAVPALQLQAGRQGHGQPVLSRRAPDHRPSSSPGSRSILCRSDSRGGRPQRRSPRPSERCRRLGRAGRPVSVWQYQAASSKSIAFQRPRPARFALYNASSAAAISRSGRSSAADPRARPTLTPTHVMTTWSTR